MLFIWDMMFLNEKVPKGISSKDLSFAVILF